MKFDVLPAHTLAPENGTDQVYLIIDNWNDYSYVTSFKVVAFDQNGVRHHLPDVRIGFEGQTYETPTYRNIDSTFDTLPGNFFSLGVNVDYYKTLSSDFSVNWRMEYLSRLRDVVWNKEILKRVEEERVFQTSHLRSISIETIRDQFTSVLFGEIDLTDFDFGFCLPSSEKFAGFDLEFSVQANSIPSTNMHAIIGRNGVGKTTLLKAMVNAIGSASADGPHFYSKDWLGENEVGSEFFSKFVSVAFSVFDPFESPQPGDARQYSYIGLTDYSGDDGAIIKSQKELFDEFADGIAACFKTDQKKIRWIQAIKFLQSDNNFSEMNLLSLSKLEGTELRDRALYLIDKMSSGHSVVILIMTLLVEKVEERTLVLIDEPESHLHPPLLSALMRSLSQLLHTRNAVAIIATHSPVVIQEIPRSCVWKVFRSKLASNKKRPDTETFGENVGTLTREVFGLEVEQSGFHTVLTQLVEQGDGYEKIISKLDGQLGDEARGILRAMIVNRAALQE